MPIRCVHSAPTVRGDELLIGPRDELLTMPLATWRSEERLCSPLGDTGANAGLSAIPSCGSLCWTNLQRDLSQARGATAALRRPLCLQSPDHGFVRVAAAVRSAETGISRDRSPRICLRALRHTSSRRVAARTTTICLSSNSCAQGRSTAGQRQWRDDVGYQTNTASRALRRALARGGRELLWQANRGRTFE